MAATLLLLLYILGCCCFLVPGIAIARVLKPEQHHWPGFIPLAARATGRCLQHVPLSPSTPRVGETPATAATATSATHAAATEASIFRLRAFQRASVPAVRVALLPLPRSRSTASYTAAAAAVALAPQNPAASLTQPPDEREPPIASDQAAAAAAAEAARAAVEARTPLLLDGSVFRGASAFAAEPLGYQTIMRGYDKSLAIPIEPPEIAQEALKASPPDPVDFLLSLSGTKGSNDHSGSTSGSSSEAKESSTEVPQSGAERAATEAEADPATPSAKAATATVERTTTRATAVFSSIDYETYFGPGVRYKPIQDGFLIFPPIYPDRVFILQAKDHLLLSQHHHQQQQQHQCHQQQQEEENKYEPAWVEATPETAARKAAAAAAAAAAAGDFGAPEYDLGGPHGATGAPGLIRNRAPSYLNPENPFLRTGRAKDKERREADTGPQQRKQWGMDEVENDIPRGPLGAPNDRFKELVDSVDWTREHPTLQDKNQYKRSGYETGLGDLDRNADSYFDPQFLGAPDAFPYSANGGLSFSWKLRWVPWLCKKHPRGGPPIKSDCFCLGGVDPLQIWFYPDGAPGSLPGFCSLKIVSRPGWHLPFPIKLWIRGAPALPVFQQQEQKMQQQQEQQGKTKGKRKRGKPEMADFLSSHLAKPSMVSVGPVWRESAECVAYCRSFCRLLDKGSYQITASPPLPPMETPPPDAPIYFNGDTDVVLNAFGGVEVGVSVGDDQWEWDDGAWDFEQWLKKQSAYPDDKELEQTLPADFTHSPNFENFKYDDVPDKHFSRYLPTSLPPAVGGELLEAALLLPGNPY